MLIEPIIDDLSQLKLHGMLDSLKTMQTQGELTTQSLIDGLGLLVSQEKLYRDNKRQQRLLKQAKLRFSQACMESVDYEHPRALNKTNMRALAGCDWIVKPQNIIFTGATGLGKSYLACALGQLACRQGFSSHYFRVPKLLEELRLASVSGHLNQRFMQLSKFRVLILDDWGLEPLNSQQRHQMLELIEDRHHLQATIITTQLPIDHWHNYIGDNTVADAILDRLTAKSVLFQLKGKSMRSA